MLWFLTFNPSHEVAVMHQCTTGSCIPLKSPSMGYFHMNHCLSESVVPTSRVNPMAQTAGKNECLHLSVAKSSQGGLRRELRSLGLSHSILIFFYVYLNQNIAVLQASPFIIFPLGSFTANTINFTHANKCVCHVHPSLIFALLLIFTFPLFTCK